MINAFRRHLIWKIFFSYLVVVSVSMAVLGLVENMVAKSVYTRQLDQMVESMMGAGHGSGMMGENSMIQMMLPEGATTEDLFITFSLATRQALVISVAAAFVTALGASVVISRRLVTPVEAIMQASKRIAAGEYQERVPVSLPADKGDELDQLAHSFNQMAAELEQVETMRRQLIGDVAHELRTPLTTLRGSLEGLADGVLPASEDTYRHLFRETERMQNLVDDLQDLSRVEAGVVNLAFGSVSLGKLVQNVGERFYLQSDAGGVELSILIEDDLPLIQGDEQRIEQVVVNLLNNALAYSDRGGAVQVRVERKEERILVKVADDGIGLAPEHQRAIFDRFYRVDKSRSRRSGGSGVGLTIAKYLVEAHGGSIWVESEGEGKGATFTFSIPIK